MAYVVMAYIVMAYIVMACVVTAYAVMACIVMAEIVMAEIVMAGRHLHQPDRRTPHAAHARRRGCARREGIFFKKNLGARRPANAEDPSSI